MTPAIQSGADELSASARNYMANEGRRAVDAGYNVLPIKPGDKFPATRNSGGWTPMSEWQRYADRPPTELELDTWAAWPDCGVGIACGDAVAIDVDVEDEAKAAELKALAISIFGHTPLIRIGRAPRFALIYRSKDTMMGGWSRKPFDILGHGRQLVAWGIHPSGCEYHWPDESPAEVYIGELPQIDRATIERFLCGSACKKDPVSGVIGV